MPKNRRAVRDASGTRLGAARTPWGLCLSGRRKRCPDAHSKRDHVRGRRSVSRPHCPGDAGHHDPCGHRPGRVMRPWQARGLRPFSCPRGSLVGRRGGRPGCLGIMHGGHAVTRVRGGPLSPIAGRAASPSVPTIVPGHTGIGSPPHRVPSDNRFLPEGSAAAHCCVQQKE